MDEELTDHVCRVATMTGDVQMYKFMSKTTNSVLDRIMGMGCCLMATWIEPEYARMKRHMCVGDDSDEHRSVVGIVPTTKTELWKLKVIVIIGYGPCSNERPELYKPTKLPGLKMIGMDIEVSTYKRGGKYKANCAKDNLARQLLNESGCDAIKIEVEDLSDSAEAFDYIDEHYGSTSSENRDPEAIPVQIHHRITNTDGLLLIFADVTNLLITPLSLPTSSLVCPHPSPPVPLPHDPKISITILNRDSDLHAWMAKKTTLYKRMIMLPSVN
ncbi:hypothetical protein F4777DRAFT_577594 [Nemania sp. FL0916]|nr:hypothetical protein F4777DRAFT_577594 [Nemania sp. FL0916]